jgi:N-acetylated-alpha-linked acidic dipeptidase
VTEIERGTQGTVTQPLDLGPVRRALDQVDTAARAWEASYARAIQRFGAWSERDLQSRAARLADVNKLLFQSEQRLTHDEGLPDRPWFRHLIYAPGFYTGYGVKTMPGIREAVEDVPDLAVATAQAARVAAALERYAAQIRAAADGLDRVQ